MDKVDANLVVGEDGQSPHIIEEIITQAIQTSAWMSDGHNIHQSPAHDSEMKPVSKLGSKDRQSLQVTEERLPRKRAEVQESTKDYSRASHIAAHGLPGTEDIEKNFPMRRMGAEEIEDGSKTTAPGFLGHEDDHPPRDIEERFPRKRMAADETETVLMTSIVATDCPGRGSIDREALIWVVRYLKR